MCYGPQAGKAGTSKYAKRVNGISGTLEPGESPMKRRRK